jgi:hypothetical protein
MINTSKPTTYLRSNSLNNIKDRTLNNIKDTTNTQFLFQDVEVYTAKGAETVPCDKLAERGDYSTFNVCFKNQYDAQIGVSLEFQGSGNIIEYYHSLAEVTDISKTYAAEHGDALSFSKSSSDANLSELTYGDLKLFVASYATPSDAFLNGYQNALTDGYAINNPSSSSNVGSIIGWTVGIFAAMCLLKCCLSSKPTTSPETQSLTAPLVPPNTTVAEENPSPRAIV